MITRPIYLTKRNRKSKYFRFICTDTKKMENSALFYIKNTISGMKKEPYERHPKEREALNYVFDGINCYNHKKVEQFSYAVKLIGEDLRSGKISGSMAMSIIRASRPKLLSYPSKEKAFLNYEQLNAVFCYMHHPVYERMPAQVNQNAIKKAVLSWKSYFASLKAYAKDPSRFTGKPSAPKYIRSDETTAWFTNQTAKCHEVNNKNVLSFINSDVVIGIGKINGKHVKTEVQPRHGGYRILVTTDDEIKEVPVPENPTRFFGIDIGLENFASVANNVGATPFLIKGNAVKAKNQWYNKRKAILTSKLTEGLDSTKSEKHSRALNALSRKRDNFIRDFMYKAAHCICKRAQALQIQVMVIGHNEGQKTGINLGDTTNQAFVSVPFAKFDTILTYTAWKYGIAVVIREESYTSKASLLDYDVIPTYKAPEKDDKDENNENETKVEYVFSGNRYKRGLYKTKDGCIINADINGAGNIIRKEYPYAFDGQDLSYLCKSVETVGYKDLYKACNPSVTKTKLSAKKKKAHKKSSYRKTCSFYHCNEKHALMEAFGVTKKT